MLNVPILHIYLSVCVEKKNRKRLVKWKLHLSVSQTTPSAQSGLTLMGQRLQSQPASLLVGKLAQVSAPTSSHVCPITGLSSHVHFDTSLIWLFTFAKLLTHTNQGANVARESAREKTTTARCSLTHFAPWAVLKSSARCVSGSKWCLLMSEL